MITTIMKDLSHYQQRVLDRLLPNLDRPLYSPRKIETMISINFDFWGNENKSI